MGSADTKHSRVRDHSLRLQPMDSVRKGALARLHERRSAVNQLIGALERYQQVQYRLGGELAATTVAEKLS